MLLLLLATTLHLPAPDRDAIMMRIEQSVQMPRGAAPIEAYDRFYRWAENNEVIAGFELPMPPYDPDKGCSISDGKGLRPCPPPTAAERENYRQALARYHGPRERKWIDGKGLPSDSIDDGGCMVVNIRYDVAADRIIEVTCNGFG